MSEEATTEIPVAQSPAINSFSVDSDYNFEAKNIARTGDFTYRFKLQEDHATLFAKFVNRLLSEKTVYDKKSLKEIAELHPELWERQKQHNGVMVIPFEETHTDLGENISDISFASALFYNQGTNEFMIGQISTTRRGHANPCNMGSGEAVSFANFITFIRKNMSKFF